jgi:hypothetical protein
MDNGCLVVTCCFSRLQRLSLGFRWNDNEWLWVRMLAGLNQSERVLLYVLLLRYDNEKDQKIASDCLPNNIPNMSPRAAIPKH